MLEIKNLRKTYGTVVAVNDVSLAINKAEFFCLLGPSGCGKTTILRLIAGFEKPTSGSILLDGRDISHIPPYKRDVNMVFQNYALFPHLSVFDNIAYGLRIKKRPSREIRDRVGSMLAMTALEGLEERMPSQLSGGQQQRVALARALVNQPSLLLLDEPLSALDHKIRQQMQVELSNLQRKVGITFLYITHNQEEALTMGDHIAVMKDGRILQLGGPEDIYEKPQNRFVADFIGSMNFLEGRFIGTNNGYSQVQLFDDSVIDVQRRVEIDRLRDILLAIRPESLRLSRNAPKEGENSVPGTILNEVYFGDVSKYIIEIRPEKRVQVLFQNYLLKESKMDPFQEGEKVNIIWSKTSGQILTE